MTARRRGKRPTLALLSRLCRVHARRPEVVAACPVADLLVEHTRWSV